MRRVVLFSTALLLLSGCGFFNAFGEAREPASGAPPTGPGAPAANPPLLAAPGGISKGETHTLFIRPTSAADDLTLEGEAYRLEVIDVRPAGGGDR